MCQIEIELATQYLNPHLEHSLHDVKSSEDHKPWRSNPANFTNTSESPVFCPGVVDLSPCWFQARKEVSTFLSHWTV
jgi:hypothetical protein